MVQKWIMKTLDRRAEIISWTLNTNSEKESRVHCYPSNRLVELKGIKFILQKIQKLTPGSHLKGPTLS